MGKRNKEENTTKKIVLNTILTLILLALIILIIIYIINKNASKTESNLLDNIQIIDESENTDEEKPEKIQQLEELQKENSDIKAYIEIEGINISYPVLQASDNNN